MIALPDVVGRAARRRAALILAPMLVLAAAGCSTYVDRNARLRGDLVALDFEKALEDVEEASRGKDRLLNLLEKGLVLHYADRWNESNDVFAEAEALSDDLYTKSVSQAVVSLFTNDESIDYRAAPFELALIPYFRAMNYVYMGEREEALVEARKAELRLRDLGDVEAALIEAGSEDEDEDAEHPAVSLEDHAFVHYLRGMLHEWGGETNDAFLAYRRAAVAYRAAGGVLDLRMPPWLGADLLRTGRILGFDDLLAEFDAAAPGVLPDDAPDERGRGTVVLFLETGFAPHRISVEGDVPIFKGESVAGTHAWALSLRHRYYYGWSGGAKIAYWLRFAMPELVDRPCAVAGARVSAGTADGHVRTVRVEDVAGRSRLYFDAAQGGVLLKTIARAVAKYLAKSEADDQGKVAGLLMNLFGAATERADTRNWLTLPRGIAMARLSLPPGEHDLRVELVDEAGRVLEVQDVTGVRVRAGDWVFLSRRVF